MMAARCGGVAALLLAVLVSVCARRPRLEDPAADEALMEETFKNWNDPLSCLESGGGGCYPEYGDVLLGRENKLMASSTCGLRRPRQYCVLSDLTDDGPQCELCDSRSECRGAETPRCHRVTEVIDYADDRVNDVKQNWWQSRNYQQNVSIQIDLGAEFHLTHTVIRFKTFRPAAMLIERSYDFGQTWGVYRYFSSNCRRDFPGVPTRRSIEDFTKVICESGYSSIEPSQGGEVVYSPLPSRDLNINPYTNKVQFQIKITNLRMNFTRLHTLGDDRLDNRRSAREKYYYAIESWKVLARCSCYGHAIRCFPLEAEPPQGFPANMVHGKCDCLHNTDGYNCERCLPLYNDREWRPGNNACQKCNCNGHATSCYYDSAVFSYNQQQLNISSGGVCQDCRHNTMGTNCELCQSGYYQVPDRPLDDPYICERCDCDELGTMSLGVCQSHRTPEIPAGTCLCKDNVEGERCDRCKFGYYNLTAINDQGCQECDCDRRGLSSNGCDPVDARCFCKRYVEGARCDRCVENYWGLGMMTVDGCEPCDCDIGGAYGPQCDVVTGQCRCRPGVEGRRCDRVMDGFYYTSLDHINIYEAESSDFTNGVIIPKSPSERDITGVGTVLVRPGSVLRFNVMPTDIIFSGDYRLIIRYLPDGRGTRNYENVQLIVEKVDGPAGEGPCANKIDTDNFHGAILDMRERHKELGETCLEEGAAYRFVVKFDDFPGSDGVTYLIDSLLLIPTTASIPIFQSTDYPNRVAANDFERLCNGFLYGESKGEPSDACKKLMFSVSVSIRDGALPCNCDRTGSYSGICRPYNGQCDCKSLVETRTCSRCEAEAWGFGQSGCSACDCDTRGSLDNLCDVNSGQCNCINNNIDKRDCSQCRRGYFNFPTCEPCNCNGLAAECSNIGECIQCAKNTAGFNCNKCADGFYGDPLRGEECRPCPCPGGEKDGPQHGNTCELDRDRMEVICDCDPAYDGDRCDRCANNYWGDATSVNGSCVRCECNQNQLWYTEGNCDADTGICSNCEFNTVGDHCEHCSPGYFGNASIHRNCQLCNCNMLGWNNSEVCNRETGKCPCLPNVVGHHCDECAPQHWGIAMGTGCSPCDCDPVGSDSPNCTQFTGMCSCKEGFAGDKCNECAPGQWGDPKLGTCQPCECNEDGTESFACEMSTGKCHCKPGITGHKCDRCDRGTTGTLPNCEPCGECFDNWDEIIQQLRNETDALLIHAENIKVNGSPSAYKDEFDRLDADLEEIQRMLNQKQVNNASLQEARRKIEHYKMRLADETVRLSEVNKEKDDLEADRIATSDKLEDAQTRAEDMRKRAEQMRLEAEKIKQDNAEGAIDTIRKAKATTDEAKRKVDFASVVDEIGEITESVDKLIKDSETKYAEAVAANENKYKELETKVSDAEERIKSIGKMVCDRKGALEEMCDSVCGGAGCDTCGENDVCSDATVHITNSIQKSTENVEKRLKQLSKDQMSAQDDAEKARNAAEEASTAAKVALDQAMKTHEDSVGVQQQISELLKTIGDFLQGDRITPEDIEQKSEEVLAKEITATPEEVQTLTEEINKLASQLNRVDEIIAETEDDLKEAMDLEKQAIEAKDEAEKVEDRANQTRHALDKAAQAQNQTREAIAQSKRDIDAASNELQRIGEILADALPKAKQNLEDAKQLEVDSQELKRSYQSIRGRMQRSKNMTSDSKKILAETTKEATKLREDYETTSEELHERAENVDSLWQRAKKLTNKADELNSLLLDNDRALQVLEGDLNSRDEAVREAQQEMADLLRRARNARESIADSYDTFNTC